MNIMWWSYTFGVCKCGQDFICSEILFSADGELVLNLTCPKCQEKASIKTHAGRLQAHANKLDIEKAMKEYKPLQSRVIRPPLKVPPVPPTAAELLTDSAFLHEMGISSADDVPLLPPAKPDEEAA